jgi:coatomer protein complex subunit gamma
MLDMPALLQLAVAASLRYDWLASMLLNSVIPASACLQAARAICNLRDVTARELTPAITVLQLFLSSSKPVLRFAAVRTLNKVGGEAYV